MIGTGPFRLRQLHRQEKRRARPQYRPTGAAARRSTGSGSRSTRAARRWCSHCGLGRSTWRCSSRRRRPSRSRTTRGTPTTTSRPRGHRQVCMRTDIGPVQGRPGAPGHGARHQPAAADREDHARRRQTVGNDNPFWKGFRVDRPDDQAAQAEPGAREGAAEGGQGGGPEGHAHDRGTSSTTPTTPRPSRPTRARRASRWASRSWTPASTTTRSPPGADYATTTPWLNRPFTLTEYGARGVPNIYITRAYMSTGHRRLERVALQEPRVRHGSPRAYLGGR